MREILFRGKRIENNEWVEGFYVNVPEHYKQEKSGKSYIVSINNGLFFEVIPETVGQYTGLTDRSGKRIFEGDIMVAKGATRPFMIAWDGLGWKMYMYDGKRIKYAYERNDIRYMRSSEVIGNRWDNPKLLEVKNE